MGSVGRWTEINTTWYQLQLVYCDLCGQVIPRRLWVVEIDGVPTQFCSPRCELLYRSYWLPDGRTSGFVAVSP